MGVPSERITSVISNFIVVSSILSVTVLLVAFQKSVKAACGNQEYRLFHRKEGLLVKENEDALSASRYALMMRRHGQTERGRKSFNRPIEYPKAAR
jgi:hypothetical protein